jgi:hypothetical protein
VLRDKLQRLANVTETEVRLKETLDEEAHAHLSSVSKTNERLLAWMRERHLTVLAVETDEPVKTRAKTTTTTTTTLSASGPAKKRQRTVLTLDQLPDDRVPRNAEEAEAMLHEKAAAAAPGTAAAGMANAMRLLKRVMETRFRTVQPTNLGKWWAEYVEAHPPQTAADLDVLATGFIASIEARCKFEKDRLLLRQRATKEALAAHASLTAEQNKEVKEMVLNLRAAQTILQATRRHKRDTLRPTVEQRTVLEREVEEACSAADVEDLRCAVEPDWEAVDESLTEALGEEAAADDADAEGFETPEAPEAPSTPVAPVAGDLQSEGDRGSEAAATEAQPTYVAHFGAGSRGGRPPKVIPYAASVGVVQRVISEAKIWVAQAPDLRIAVESIGELLVKAAQQVLSEQKPAAASAGTAAAPPGRKHVHLRRHKKPLKALARSSRRRWR